MAVQMAPHFERVSLSDASEDLILLWQALQNGWEPPETVSEEEYQRVRYEEPSALRAFIGYGCSFGGKWFGGYARYKGRNYAVSTKRVLEKKIESLYRAKFGSVSYEAWSDCELSDSIIYCDPPYRNTTGYTRVGAFDSDKFWSTIGSWDGTVFVSEYTAPEGWKSIWSAEPLSLLAGGAVAARASEHLWVKE